MTREIFFVHINKCGGSSIENALGLPFRHTTASSFLSTVGPSRWRKGFSFSFVRNPWDRAVSHYHYLVATNRSDMAESPISFSEWAEKVYVAQDPAYYDIPAMFMPQSNWLLAEGAAGPDDVIVDFVGRFERLQRDFDHIGEVLGLDVPRKLPHLKKTERGPYQNYYTGATRSIIDRWFEDDIERFGYAFD